MSKIKNSLSSDDVKHVAQLAKLKLSDKEISKFQKQLSEVIDYINVLKHLDTSRTQPTSQVTSLENVFREDTVLPSMSQKEALSNAKSSYKGYFKISAIFS